MMRRMPNPSASDTPSNADAQAQDNTNEEVHEDDSQQE